MWGRLIETPKEIYLATGNDGAVDPNRLYHKLVKKEYKDFPADRQVKLGYKKYDSEDWTDDETHLVLFNARVRGLYSDSQKEFVLLDVEVPTDISNDSATYLMEKDFFIKALEENRKESGVGGFDPYNTGYCYEKDGSFHEFGKNYF